MVEIDNLLLHMALRCTLLNNYNLHTPSANALVILVLYLHLLVLLIILMEQSHADLFWARYGASRKSGIW